ncbi:MAG TPA: M28 family peptidase [Bryobacteraceae bacterium]|nr:M28 family peptidase [Bryobacteraceae bacterium]
MTPLVPDSLIRTLLAEISVDNSLRQTAAIASHARYPNSAGFFETADYVAAQARSYGLQNVHVERFPTREPMWDAVEAELDLISPVFRRLSTLQRVPELLAQHSRDGDVTAELVDVGDGTSESDFDGKQVNGKILLADGQPGPVWRAMGERGAAGMICAGAGEYFGRHTPADAVVWGEAPPGAFAMMISPRQGARLRALLKRGVVKVRMHGRAARVTPGAIGMVEGEIPGEMPGSDIVLAAHLDHQKPGANDNASGSGTLLELARTVNHLIAAGKIPKPKRTLRFWWTTEIRSEEAYFRQHPEEAKKIVLSVVLDQAGGELRKENNFIIIDNPTWLPSYADDLIENLAEYVKERYAPAEHAPDALWVARGGSSQSMRTVYWDYQEITDEVAFESREAQIPGIALAVPSLDLIHTNLDTTDKLDPTWMKRSAVMTLAPALYVANAGTKEAAATLDYTFHRAAARLAQSADPGRRLAEEQQRLDSVRELDHGLDTSADRARLASIAAALEEHTVDAK